MRVGINIPDDLLKRLEPFKAVTNISKICRVAIKTQVEAYERAMAHAKEDGMSVIAQRLGEELTPPVVDWELLGIEDAQIWVQLAKLEDFECLLSRMEVFDHQGKSLFEIPIPRVQGDKFFELRINNYDEWFDKQIEANPDVNPYVEAKLIYQRGKISYILAVWQMAKGIAQERYKANIISLQEAKGNARKEIQVPDRLKNS